MQKRTYSFRFYRNWMNGEGLSRIRLIQGESDLLVLCREEAREECGSLLEEARSQVTDAISSVSGFRDSLIPLDVPATGYPVADEMLRASMAWNTGPMAAVAGAIAHHVARELHRLSDYVVVENGGDIYAYGPEQMTFRIYPGEESPFPEGFGFTVDPSPGIAVCTSSGRVGPSLSMGLADAVVSVARNGAYADAAATAIANLVSGEEDVPPVILSARHPPLEGLIIMAGNRMGIRGGLELVGLKGA